MGNKFRIILEIDGNKLTRYLYEFYPDFRDQNGRIQKELGEKLLAELDIPGGWDKSTISDHRPGVLFRWMGGLSNDLAEYNFKEVLAELNEGAKVAQELISDAIAKAVIARIAVKG